MARMKFDKEKVNWEVIKNPCERFSLFQPTPYKVEKLLEYLMERRWYVDDSIRDKNILSRIVLPSQFFSPNSLTYEIEDFRGILGFTNIIPEHKASVMLKLWSKKAWSHKFVRDARKLFDTVMKEFMLHRLETSTPDEGVIKMARLGGFKHECGQKYGFRWKGKFYTNHLMSITR